MVMSLWPRFLAHPVCLNNKYLYFTYALLYATKSSSANFVRHHLPNLLKAIENELGSGKGKGKFVSQLVNMQDSGNQLHWMHESGNYCSNSES